MGLKKEIGHYLFFPRTLFTVCRDASGSSTRPSVIARSSTTWQSSTTRYGHLRLRQGQCWPARYVILTWIPIATARPEFVERVVELLAMTALFGLVLTLLIDDVDQRTSRNVVTQIFGKNIHGPLIKHFPL